MEAVNVATPNGTTSARWLDTRKRGNMLHGMPRPRVLHPNVEAVMQSAMAVFTVGSARATVYVPEGGSLLEINVPGPGWIVCGDDAEWEREDRETPCVKQALAMADAFHAAWFAAHERVAP